MGFFTRRSQPPRRPWALEFRSSVWFTTGVVGFGIMGDLLVYSIIIPVLPFQLENLGYTGVSGLTGWLLCAYSGGLVVSTIPIAIYSEKFSLRKMPLVFGLLALLGSQILLMEAPAYWVMALARVFQGISSSMVWIVGLALLCDVTPERSIGRQLGFAMTGLPIGLLIGSPAGGVLYNKYGFHAPFIFGEIVSAVDLIGRLLIIERKDALKWGHDPSLFGKVPDAETPIPTSISEASVNDIASGSQTPIRLTLNTESPALEKSNPIRSDVSLPSALPSPFPSLPSPSDVPLQVVQQNVEPPAEAPSKPPPFYIIIKLMCQAPRALVALLLALVYGVVQSMQEPSLPLHLQDVWGFGSYQTGLVYLASVVPALISSPLAGWYADREGSDHLTSMCLLLTLPWWIVMTIRKSLPLFVVALALQSFFVNGLVPPVTAELAAVSRQIQGVGYAHVYGAFNLAFGIGTAVGPIIGGQIYDHAKHGWTAVCLITAALIVICIALSFCFTGADPVLAKFLRQYHKPGMAPPPKADSEDIDVDVERT